MAKTDKLNILFTDWENSIPEYANKFVRDGIVNEDAYKLAHTKILLLMKEPNKPEQAPGDFREWWKESIKYGFSYRLAEWAYGILNDFPPYDDIWRNKDNVNHAIRSIAFMKVKKNGGGGTAEYERMIEHAEKTKASSTNKLILFNQRLSLLVSLGPSYEAGFFPT